MERSFSEGGSGRPAEEPVDEVRYEVVGSVAVLTIDRQHRRNAVNGATAERLLEGYNAFEADDDARVLVLTGAGPDAFCAGADLKELTSLGDRVLGGEAPLGFTRTTPTKPTIAAINGWCLAGGLELALWCDLRIAHPDAQLGFPERRWGVPLIDGGTQRLPRIVGMGRALDLILTGRIMHALEALDWGLLTELDEDPLNRALEIAQGLASFPQQTMLADRGAAIEGFGLSLSEGLALEAKAGPETLQAAVEGAERFAGGEGRGGAGAGV
jgi:enoyl-CoA hydratase/carnithine racemase